MTRLLEIFGFLAVLLRGGTLAFTSLTVGGVAYALLILRPDAEFPEEERQRALQSTRRLIAISAAGLMCVNLVYLAANSAMLASTLDIKLGAIAGAAFFVSAAASCFGALILFAAVLRWRTVSYWLAVPCLVLLASLLATSHSMARLEDRIVAAAATTLHQSATALWIGGLCALLVTVRSARSTAAHRVMMRRFSRLSLISVSVLLGAGLCLAWMFVGSLSGLYGTNYGVMVGAKAVLFGLMLLLGGFNFLAVGRRRPVDYLLARVQRLSEAELGIGLTIILTAASLTSQPPAIDLKADRATAGDIATRFAPRLPRLSTPPLGSLSPSTEQEYKDGNNNSLNGYVPGQTYVPPNAGDIAWSEYNHHWAGVVVLIAGLLAIFSRWTASRWARHWPLAFLGLGVFLLLRADPENWPLGPNGFWESFAVPDVAQHRLFVLLIAAFAGFEWGVQTGRLKSRTAALVFPLVCAGGGAMLMTHTHALSNIKEELLAELSHVPLAIFGVVAGWSRWLELRLHGPGRRIAGYVWPPSLMLVGVVLLLYREA